MSPLVQESAPYDCPIWAPFDPHSAPFKPHMAPFKWQPVVIDKPAMHQNDQEDELSHMGPRSAHTTAPFGPHLTLIWPHSPFSPHAPHSNPMWPHSNGNQWSERNKASIKMINMMS